jgi:hypothetical protein
MLYLFGLVLFLSMATPLVQPVVHPFPSRGIYLWFLAQPFLHFGDIIGTVYIIEEAIWMSPTVLQTFKLEHSSLIASFNQNN